MSKLRQHFPMPSATDDAAPTIEAPPEGDPRGYVVFTQLRAATPLIYAGWLNAADDRAALYYAREHYGRDQKCVAVAAIPREALHSSDGIYTCGDRCDEPQSFVIFAQAEPGGPWRESMRVEAEDGARALSAAKAESESAREANALWAVAASKILHNAEDELLFRLTDQSYRLARGYGRLVHQKWELFRSSDALRAYEREDLEEAF